MVKSKRLRLEDNHVCAKSSHSLPKLSSLERGHLFGEDRISNLPQPMRHHILTKLPSEDAMRTMILSKAWKDDWLTSPCLDLTKEKRGSYFADTQLENKFLDFAFRILARRNDLNCSSVERLHLFLSGPPETRRTRSDKKADNLLYYAVSTFVIHELELRSYSKDIKYELSKDIIQYAHSLRSLVLEHLKLDQQTIAILADNCPLLKSLELYFCDFVDLKVRVSGFHKLINLSVISTTTTFKGDNFKVEIIDAPSLEKFSFFGPSDYHAGSPSIDVISDSACKGLKHMDLVNVWFDRRSLNRLLSHLPNLQHLNLSCYFLCRQRLDICSPSLKHLQLGLHNLLEQLHIDAPSLTNFVYTYYALFGMPTIVPLNADAFHPRKVAIHIESTTITKFQNVLQDVQFNRLYRQLDGVSWHLKAHISIFQSDTLPCFRGLHSSAFAFERVLLSFNLLGSWLPNSKTSQILFTNILDPALRLFPNLKKCIIWKHNSESGLMMFKLEFKYKGSEVRGSWQQRIDEVKIGNIRGFEMYISPLRNQFEEAIKANTIVQCSLPSP